MFSKKMLNLFGMTSASIIFACFYSINSFAMYDEKITNGTKVPQGKYQFFAALGPKDQIIDAKFGGQCGGALVGSTWILTAKHCVVPPANQYKVAVGSADLSDPASYQTANVIKAFYFQEDDEDNPTPWVGNDIVLLKLDREINLKPIKITQTRPFQGIATAIGQGAINASLDIPPVVYEVDIPIVSDDVCDSSLLNQLHMSLVPQREFCAGSFSGERKNVLYGDSGGPLIIKINDEYFLSGIVTRLTTLDFNINSPCIFTNLSFFYSWIKDTIDLN